MADDVVHIREGSRKVAFCGEELIKSTFDPFMFTNYYNPDRKLYCVYRVLTEEEAYPIYEQVGVFINPNFCDHCLAGIGLFLLRDFEENRLCI